MLILDDSRNPDTSKSSRVGYHHMGFGDDRMHEVCNEVAEIILFIIVPLKVYLIFYEGN